MPPNTRTEYHAQRAALVAELEPKYQELLEACEDGTRIQSSDAMFVVQKIYCGFIALHARIEQLDRARYGEWLREREELDAGSQV